MNHNKRKNKQKTSDMLATHTERAIYDQISRLQTKLGMVGGMDTCHLVLELEAGRSLGLHGPKLRSTIEDDTDSQPLVSTLTHMSLYPHARVHSLSCATR